MQTTLKQQSTAVKRAATIRKKELDKMANAHFATYVNSMKVPKKFQYRHDKYWKALNDAYSTLIALRLNEKINADITI